MSSFKGNYNKNKANSNWLREQTVRQRRYDLYAQAYRDVLAWREMFYRILRRNSGTADTAALIHKFHDLQERIDYNTGWIGAESALLSQSYENLVDTVRTTMDPLIRDAWETPLDNPWSSIATNIDLYEKEKEARYAIELASKNFLSDIRHSFWFLRTGILVIHINRWRRSHDLLTRPFKADEGKRGK